MNISVKNKIFFLFISVIVIAVSVVGWYGFVSAKKSYIDSALYISKGETKALSSEINGELGTIPSDVTYNVNFYALAKLLIWEDLKDQRKINYWKNVYISALKDYLLNKKLYYQVRILDVNGKEKILLKYDAKTNTVKETSEENLQDKSSRNYFQNALRLKKGEFYISPMNLNIENGMIEKPYVPVVRYAAPLINGNGDLKGVIVLNFNAHYIIKGIKSAKAISETRNIEDFYLLNEDGYYLYNKKSMKQWGFQTGTGYNFKKDYPDVFEQFKDKEEVSFIYNNKIFSMHKIYPGKFKNKYRFWYLVSVIDVDVALSSLDTFKNVFFGILISVLIFGLLFINSYITKIMRPLTKITTQLKALAQGEIKKEEIVYNSNDEIGQITKSTSILVDAIETTINQAKAVSQGDFSKDIELLGKNDELGLALKAMTKRLTEITSLAQNLAQGNYDIQIVASSSEDQLGLALIKMVEYLESITQLMEDIAVGEMNLNYQKKSSEDRLGAAIIDMVAYLRSILHQARAITNEDFSHSIKAKSPRDELGIALVTMTDMLRETTTQSKNEIWFSEGIGEFSDKLTGIDDAMSLSKEAISIACRYVKASSGVLYTYDKKSQKLNLVASYAYTSRQNLSNSFELGSGVVGQVALEREPILLQNIKDDTFEIQTGTTISRPKEVYTFPLMFEGELFGVMEMMSFESFTQLHKNYLFKIADIFSTVLHTTIQNIQIKELLDKSQRDYEEMQLKSEELQQTNVQMEEQAQQLQMQAENMKKQNKDLTSAKADLDKQAEELMQASRYKSEFLANMSHELRTPLNSIILLSKMLRDKIEDEGESKKAEVIHNAGNDLLLLINDILDLSKIEAGQMEVDITETSSYDLGVSLKELFDPISDDKNLDFIIKDDLHASFETDITKVSQILKNLLSNAFKFTKEGSVTLHMYDKDEYINFAVIDTGIGIPEDKLGTIFEAFKQVDGSITREYGGTGLGLSISLRFATLLGGTLDLKSKEGEGSTFTLRIPKRVVKQDDTIPADEIKAENSTEIIEVMHRDRYEESKESNLRFENNTILLVDDDSRNIFTLSALFQEMGAQTLHALNGQEALGVLRDNANSIDLILMDIMMPKMDGYETITQIRKNHSYDSIAIIAITAKAMDEDREKCLNVGANDYITKPINEKALMQLSRIWIDKMR